jgi:hypothetical protein
MEVELNPTPLCRREPAGAGGGWAGPDAAALRRVGGRLRHRLERCSHARRRQDGRRLAGRARQQG